MCNVDSCIGVCEKEDINMDNGFMAYIQAFIDFILKIISIFKSNDNNSDNNEKK